MDTSRQDVFTTDQVAWILEVSRRTIQRWDAKEKIAKPWRTPGGRAYYSMEHVRAMLPHLEAAAVKRLVDRRMATYVASGDEEGEPEPSEETE